MSALFLYQICRNRMRSCRVLIIWIKTVSVWKTVSVTFYQYTDLLSYHLLYAVEWLHLQIFQNICVFIQMIKTLLFIKQSLQVWYQNEEDIHFFLWYGFNLPICEKYLRKLDFQKCPGTFLLSVCFITFK